MPSAVIDAIDAYRAGLLRNEQAQMAEAARRWLQVEQAIQAQVDALAYELANRWLETGRSDGIPAIRLGRRLLVNRPALYELAEDTALM